MTAPVLVQMHQVTTALVDHLAAATPPGQLVGVAVRHLREPAKAGGLEYRGLADFKWVRPEALARVDTAWQRMLTEELLEQWRWVHDVCGGPAQCARRRYLHGERLPGVPMLRPVTCARRPVNGGGTLDELTGVLGLVVDLDVSERRDGDRRRYCPTVAAGVEFLTAFAPSVILDGGGGLVAVFLFDQPADASAARRLGRDLLVAVERATAERGWAFDSPPPHSAWVKVPGCVDLFYGHTTVEVAHGAAWAFDELRAAVPVTATRPTSAFHYAGGPGR